MKELTIQEIETIVKRDENRMVEAKKTTGELAAGMQSGSPSSTPRAAGSSSASIPKS